MKHNSYLKRGGAFLLTVAMVIASATIPKTNTKAETYRYPGLTIYNGSKGVDYKISNGTTDVGSGKTLDILTSTELTITGDNRVAYTSETGDIDYETIIVPTGVNANIVLRDANMIGEIWQAPIWIQKGASLQLTIQGNNTLAPRASGYSLSTTPSIQVDNGASLVLQEMPMSPGTLTASSNDGSAVIGASGESTYEGNAGKITINSGTYNLESTCGSGMFLYSGAAIGGAFGNHNSFESITINGGTINASADKASAIGDGLSSLDINEKSGNITINGGNVVATSKISYADPIGTVNSVVQEKRPSVIINGGNVESRVAYVRPVNNDGTSLYKTRVTLKDENGNIVPSTRIESYTVICDGKPYTISKDGTQCSYGTNYTTKNPNPYLEDFYSKGYSATDNNGQAYLWLPQNSVVTGAATVSDDINMLEDKSKAIVRYKYQGNVDTTTDDQANGILTRVTDEVSKTNLYQLSLDLYNGAMTKSQDVTFDIKDGDHSESFVRRVNVDTYHGTIASTNFYLGWNLSSAAKITMSGVSDGKKWSYTPAANISGNKISITGGQKLVKATLLFSGDKFNSNNASFPVSNVKVSQNGTVLNGTDATTLENLVVTSDKTSLAGDNKCKLELYMPAGTNTDLSVTVPELNDGNAITKSGVTIVDGQSNDIDFYTDKSHTHTYDADGICKECGAYEPAVLANDGVYEISNTGELFWFAEYENKGNQWINGRLTADITISKKDGAVRPWTPIGLNSRYAGNFDGNYHTISGLCIKSISSRQLGSTHITGFIGYKGGGYVKNLGLVNAEMAAAIPETDYAYLQSGFICGYSDDTMTIDNCFVVGKIDDGVSCMGICGNSSERVSISNCYAMLTGNTKNSTPITFAAKEITNCYSLSGTFSDHTKEKGRGIVKDSAAFSSGEVCWLLNGEKSDGAYGQTLGTDKYPLFLKSSKAVYKDGDNYKNYVCNITASDASSITSDSAEIAVNGTNNANVCYASGSSKLGTYDAVKNASGSGKCTIVIRKSNH
jgi:hypothetical protein